MVDDPEKRLGQATGQAPAQAGRKMDPEQQQRVAHEGSRDRQRQIEEARHRIEDRGELPWEESRGVISVVDAVRDRTFPAGVEELNEAVGDREVYLTGDLKVPMRRVLGKLRAKGETEFPSLKDFQEVVQRHWEGLRNLEVPLEQWAPGERTQGGKRT